MFIVDKNLEGIEHIDTPLFSHTYAHHHSIYRFKNVSISEKNIIGEEGIGMDYTHAWFRHERLGIAARCCGAAERYYRELRADRIWEGTSEIHRIIIANSLYKRGLQSLIE